jgi:hypothetical protein
MLDQGPVLDHREHPLISFIAPVGRGALFSPQIEREVGKRNCKTAQNGALVGNRLGMGAIFLMT